jgi:hypothetical protein
MSNWAVEEAKMANFGVAQWLAMELTQMPAGEVVELPVRVEECMVTLRYGVKDLVGEKRYNWLVNKGIEIRQGIERGAKERGEWLDKQYEGEKEEVVTMEMCEMKARAKMEADRKKEE